jgi:hypothetical protein
VDPRRRGKFGASQFHHFVVIHFTNMFTYKVGFQVHAWLMHSVDCIEGNVKPGVKFWGVIADFYNSTTDPHR